MPDKIGSMNTLLEEVKDQLADPELEGAFLTPPEITLPRGVISRQTGSVEEGTQDPQTANSVRVTVNMAGPEGGAYDHTFRVVLEFSRPEYPAVAPRVLFPDVFHWMMLSGESELENVSQYLGPRPPTILNVLLLVNCLLQGPPHPCDNCNARFNHYAALHSDRRSTIRQYMQQRLHKELFEPADRVEGLEGWVDAAVLAGVARGEIRPLLREEGPGVYSFPLFTPRMCTMLLEEVAAYEASGLPVVRPNSMNNYGLVLNDGIGLEPLVTKLMRDILQPVAAALFSPGAGTDLNTHHSFIVRYRLDQDQSLDMHTDDSDVTFNVCLGTEFTGSGLTFCGEMGAPDHRKLSMVYKHEVGRCVVHLGRRRHGADRIESGERNNLIVWCRSWAYRASTDYLNLSYEKEVFV